MKICETIAYLFRTVLSVLIIAVVLLVFVVLSPFIFLYHAACFVCDYTCLCWDYLRTRARRYGHGDR